MVKCQFCGTLYVDEHGSKEEDALTVWAYEKLRQFKFADAMDDFDKILSMYPLSFEAYLGKVLAKHKIVLYSRRGTSVKKPRFFGDKIVKISEDDDFKSAVENAPEDTAKTYNEISRMVDKMVDGYQNVVGKESFDVVLCATGYDKANPNEKITNLIDSLKEKDISTYFVQGLSKENESESFNALKTAKVFVLYANKTTGYNDPEIKNLFDRYRYFISQKEKTATSFVVAFDNGVTMQNLPKEFAGIKSVVDLSEVGVVDELMLKIKTEKEKSVSQVAKIEKVKLDKVSSVKKAKVDVESVSTTELGNYKVENIELTGANRNRWIFISLKNGDFESAKDLAKKELEKDPNNAELLFADLLCDYKVRTAGEFFSDIANFKEKDRLDNILKYAPKDFAEMIVDNWSNLIISLDSEEYYNSFLLYLAQYNTPNRDKLVTAAENKALDTLDQSLIEKVLKCFQNNDVDRFVNFYFLLAQKSGDDNYYKKVLDIDAGHEQSNIAILLKNFKDVESKLSFRKKDVVENTLKYLNADKRAQLISAVINMILPICYVDMKKTQEQLDFYLAYVEDDIKLSQILKTVALHFQQMRFYVAAEKYIAIAISKNKTDAELYWILIQIKCHCNSEAKLVKTNVKVSQMPEWESLLACADESQAEKYGAIISKSNLYSGEKTGLAPEWLDKKNLAEKLNDFLIRNNKILLEMAKEEGKGVLRGANYFKLQLEPFENYVTRLKGHLTLEEYNDVAKKIATRLDLLDLTLDMSINVTNLEGREAGLRAAKAEKLSAKNARRKTKETNAEPVVVDEETERRKKFIRRYLFGFLEIFPVLFATLLLIVIIAIPKEVYMYFNQNFVIALVCLGALFSIVHMSYYLFKKKKMHQRWKIANIVLMTFGFLNVALMCIGFYLMPTVVTINNAKEFNRLIHNAPYAELRLEKNIDMSGWRWKPTAFMGKLDGNGKSVTNLTVKSNKNITLFYSNTGTIENIRIYYAGATYKNVSNFGGIAVSNTGTIKDCVVRCEGDLIVRTNKNFTFGGVASKVKDGTISGCSVGLNGKAVSTSAGLNFGGIVGIVRSGGSSKLIKNEAETSFQFEAKNADDVNIGGLVGLLEGMDGGNLDLSRNKATVHYSVSGNAYEMYVGGLVGDGRSESKNNYSVGNLDVMAVGRNGAVGGLYGKYLNSNVGESINHSYSTVTISCENGMKVGSLVGSLGGKIAYSFTSTEKVIAPEPFLTSLANYSTAVQRDVRVFNQNVFGFDTKIWDISGIYPTLK